MASFQADADEADTLVLTWANSFVEAHRACGFMNQLNTDYPESTKQYDVYPRVIRKEKDE